MKVGWAKQEPEAEMVEAAPEVEASWDAPAPRRWPGMVAGGLLVLLGLGWIVALGITLFQASPTHLLPPLTLAAWIGLACAVVAAGFTAGFIGAITVRMSGHYLALATLCFGISFYFLVGNSEMLGRFNGLTGIAPSLRESAHALGLPAWAVLWRVELPLAAPTIWKCAPEKAY